MTIALIFTCLQLLLSHPIMTKLTPHHLIYDVHGGDSPFLMCLVIRHGGITRCVCSHILFNLTQISIFSSVINNDTLSAVLKKTLKSVRLLYIYLHICGALTNNDDFSVILVLLSSILHKNTYKKYTQTGLFQPPMRIHVVHKCILVRKYCVTKSHIIVTYNKK